MYNNIPLCQDAVRIVDGSPVPFYHGCCSSRRGSAWKGGLTGTLIDNTLLQSSHKSLVVPSGSTEIIGIMRRHSIGVRLSLQLREKHTQRMFNAWVDVPFSWYLNKSGLPWSRAGSSFIWGCPCHFDICPSQQIQPIIIRILQPV